MSVNKVIIIGRLTADPEIRRTQQGKPIANFSVATSESWRCKNTGDRKKKSEFHRVVCFSEGLCKVIENYAKKGSQIYIEGQLQTRKWQDQEGKDRYSTEIVLQGYGGVLQLLDKREDSGGNNQSGGYQDQPQSSSNHSDINDEIPF